MYATNGRKIELVVTGVYKDLLSNNIQILFILTSVFAKLLAVACIIGVPLAYYLSSRWLESFVYQTSYRLWFLQEQYV